MLYPKCLSSSGILSHLNIYIYQMQRKKARSRFIIPVFNAFPLLFIFAIFFSQNSYAQCSGNSTFLGNDTAICIGSNVGLSAPNGYLSYLWSTNATSQNININTTGTYWCEASAMSTINLVTNGDFSSGNTGFSTGHIYGTGGSWGLLSGSGQYAISTNSNLTHNNFPNCGDHTSGNGNYMIVNGSSVANLTVWCQTINVTPNTNYFFSAWITSVVSASPAVLSFTVNGTSLGTNLNVSSLTCNWQNYFQTWNSGTNTSATICITNQNTAGGGNDFGIDDISFRPACIDVDTIVVSALPAPATNIGPDTSICVGDTIQMDATDTLGSSYSWSTGDTTPTIHVFSSNLYLVTVTRGNCTETDSRYVQELNSPDISFPNDTIICEGSSFPLTMTASSASFLWSSGSSSSFLIANADTTYWGSATNICGISSDTIVVEVDSTLIVDLGPPDTVLCTGESYMGQSNVIGDSYLWNNGSVLDHTVIQNVFTYSLSVTNVCGTFSDTINVDYDDIPQTYLGVDSIYCITDLQTLSTNWSRSTFLWNTGNQSNSILADTNGTYWVSVTNLCGQDGDTISLAYHNPIFFSLGIDTNLCLGDSINVFAPATNATWAWNDGTTDSVKTIYSAGLYSVAANNKCGTFTDSIFISEINIPEIHTLINDTLFCEGLSFSRTIDPSTSATITWMDGFNLYQRIFDSSSVYSYGLNNICGSVYDTFTVNVDTAAMADLGNDTTICYGEVVTKSFNLPNHTYLWSSGSMDSTQEFFEKGFYTITITSPGLCETYSQFTINPCESQPYIPNAFTPGNLDNINTHFIIKGEGIRKFRIVIFDRWGKQVFESFDMANSWDGTIRGQDAASGVYSYKLWYNTGIRSESITLFGEIHLIR